MFIKTSSVSKAWLAAVAACVTHKGNEVLPLVVDLCGFEDRPEEDIATRAMADESLARTGNKRIDTTASLIFPERSWLYHRDKGAKAFFEYYRQVYFPRLKDADPLNARGTYFQRMVCYGESNDDQLSNLLDAYRSGLRRRSAFQLVIYDPRKDHSLSKRLGFPCLDYVAFSPNKNGTLSLTAMYAMQYIYDRSYGNYLGLCALGRFIASELGLTFNRLTCVAAVGKLGSIDRKTGQLLVSHLGPPIANQIEGDGIVV